MPAAPRLPKDLIPHQSPEVKALILRDRIFRYAQEMDADIPEVVVAVAEVLAVAIANCDRQGGGQTLTRRLDTFLRLVEATYRRHRTNMDTAAFAAMVEGGPG